MRKLPEPFLKLFAAEAEACKNKRHLKGVAFRNLFVGPFRTIVYLQNGSAKDSQEDIGNSFSLKIAPHRPYMGLDM